MSLFPPTSLFISISPHGQAWPALLHGDISNPSTMSGVIGLCVLGPNFGLSIQGCGFYKQHGSIGMACWFK